MSLKHSAKPFVPRDSAFIPPFNLSTLISNNKHLKRNSTSRRRGFLRGRGLRKIDVKAVDFLAPLPLEQRFFGSFLFAAEKK